jgi:hypothetical protein
MTLRLTEHARVRLQQRGIPESVLEWLIAYGSTVHDHRGGELVFFDHRARNRLRRALDAAVLKKIEPKLDTYAVVTGGNNVITVGHRTKRINRH